jgi:acetoin utilization deacetylase AcuC-like enzyme
MGLISFLHHDKFRLHENPSMHPESPDRLNAIEAAIKQSDIGRLLVNTIPRSAIEADLCTIHSPSYIEHIEKAARVAKRENKLIQLDGDTFMSPKSLEVAKLAAGASFTAIDTLADDKVFGAFVAIRPPGHHAMANRQMGFCLFNNIALAADYARKHLGHKKVLIIDWDVHHGNGTQDIFYNEPGVLFISMHQYPHWPYATGWLTEDGAKEGKGYNINIPLPPGTGDKGHLLAWDSVIEPVAQEYKPDIILVSAGYDAHKNDHMSNQNMTAAGFGALASRLQNLAQSLDVKPACFLEGGYHTKALADSVVATLISLAENANEDDIHSLTEDQSAQELSERLSSVVKHFSSYWKNLK